MTAYNGCSRREAWELAAGIRRSAHSRLGSAYSRPLSRQLGSATPLDAAPAYGEDIPLLARFVPASVECLVSNLDDAAHYCSAPDSHNDCCRYDHYCSRNRDASYDSNDGDGAA